MRRNQSKYFYQKNVSVYSGSFRFCFTVSTMQYIYIHHIIQRLFWFYLLGTCKKLAKSTVIWFVLAYIMYFVTFSRPGTRFSFSDTHISGHLINFHSAFRIKTFILFNSYLLTLHSSWFFVFCWAWCVRHFITILLLIMVKKWNEKNKTNCERVQ